MNLYALDHLVIEVIRVPGFERTIPSRLRSRAALRLLPRLATAAFPGRSSLVWGHPLAAAAPPRHRRSLRRSSSRSTFRHYVPIGPRWAWLTACGAVLIAAALWAHRRLRDAAGGAWRGLTASPLYSADDAGISPLGALGAHIAGPAAPEPERPGFTGGGGEFGGGGASGTY